MALEIDIKTLESQLSRQLERKLRLLRESVHGTPQSSLSEDGAEIPDPVPIVIHTRDGRLTDFDAVKSFMSTHLSAAADLAEMDTLEEANDFDVDDEIPLPETPYEIEADHYEEDRAAIREHEEFVVNKGRREAIEAAIKVRKARKKPDSTSGSVPADDIVPGEK
jgi:hypothetical protein